MKHRKPSLVKGQRDAYKGIGAKFQFSDKILFGTIREHLSAGSSVCFRTETVSVMAMQHLLKQEFSQYVEQTLILIKQRSVILLTHTMEGQNSSIPPHYRWRMHYYPCL